ncbi:25630_t:CDS:1, partial [Gigaspora rosea]
ASSLVSSIGVKVDETFRQECVEDTNISIRKGKQVYYSPHSINRYRRLSYPKQRHFN